MSLFTYGQNQTSESESQNRIFVYCEIVGTQKFLSTILIINVDYGQDKNIGFLKYLDSRIKADDGKVKSFNSMVDALNYMGESGWVFAQAYTVTISDTLVYHWLLKQEIK